jgi:riboflavin synthase alpha subunit
VFTGIIREIGTVVSAGEMLVVRAPTTAASCRPGDSVNVSGVCLTAERVEPGGLHFRLMPQTIAGTTLARARSGQRVNIEPALRSGEPLGGHIVLGHVDAVGSVSRLQRQGDSAVLEIACPAAMMPYLAPKGSIAVDGVSLTVSKVQQAGFAVSLVKFTIENTTLGNLRAGEEVNLEADVLAKYVESVLASRGETESGRLTLESLAEEGYL